jgi:isoleucyl-tRNA synthetase
LTPAPPTPPCSGARTPVRATTDGPEADLYLEGHDQHRGWFHSSLLTACAMYDRAPYKGILTHGFTVDSKGHKMSKSAGNGVDPQETSKKLGAEIIRLWVAASDYSGDIAGDDKILARVVDTYRRIRNTLKFLLANVSDFDPAANTVAPELLLEIDRYALSRAAALQADILAHYEVYEFHPVVAKLQIYCSEDLGSFYLDILKDRLYTTAANSLARRSAQTALWQITQAMLRWMAPFLSFTAEEAWSVLGAGGENSCCHPRVHFHGQLQPVACRRHPVAGQVGPHSRNTRRGQQRYRGVAGRGQGGLLAASQCQPHGRSRRPRAARRSGR